jgi:hypothetical protein
MPAFSSHHLFLSLMAVTLFCLAPARGNGLLGQTQSARQPHSANPRALVLQAGQWHVDLDGTVAAARVELQLDQKGRWLFVPGLTYAHGPLRSVTETDVLVPEALIHLQLTRGRIRPYVGGGAGFALINLFDRTIDGVISVGAGLRADLTPEWGARLETDTRIWGKLRAGSVGWSVGVARRF